VFGIKGMAGCRYRLLRSLQALRSLPQLTSGPILGMLSTGKGLIGSSYRLYHLSLV
jgi:hypothetical protein